MEGVPGGVGALHDVGDGHQRGGERGPAPAALDRAGEHRAGRRYRRQRRAVDVLGVQVGERGEQDAGEHDGEVDGEEALGAGGRARHPGQGRERSTG